MVSSAELPLMGAVDPIIPPDAAAAAADVLPEAGAVAHVTLEEDVLISVTVPALAASATAFACATKFSAEQRHACSSRALLVPSCVACSNCAASS